MVRHGHHRRDWPPASIDRLAAYRLQRSAIPSTGPDTLSYSAPRLVTHTTRLQGVGDLRQRGIHSAFVSSTPLPQRASSRDVAIMRQVERYICSLALSFLRGVYDRPSQ
ncbi:hypothetical protein CN149_14185 [Sinorhizobium meliloti]|nr:hypothetical protein CN149_14185 [Sinorhizobium meliloti]